MIAVGNKVGVTKVKIEGHLTDEGQIEEVEQPLRNAFTKDRPAIVLFVAVTRVSSGGRIR